MKRYEYKDLWLSIIKNDNELIERILESRSLDIGVRDKIIIENRDKNGLVKIITPLYAFGEIDYHHQFSVVKMVMETRNKKILDLILKDKMIDPSIGDNFAIGYAARNNLLQHLDCLLKDPRVDPSARCDYALDWSSEKMHKEVVEVLLNDKRVDPSSNECSALANLSKKYDFDGDTYLIKKILNDVRVDPSSNDNEALIVASKHGNFDIVKLLLKDSRVDPTARNYEAFFNACSHFIDNVELVKLFVNDHRFNFSICDNKGLLIAINKGNNNIVKYFLEQRVIEDNPVNKEYSILIAENCSAGIVKYIIDCDLKSQIDKYDLIFTALENQKYDTVRLLLTYKDIDPSFNNNLCIDYIYYTTQIDLLHFLLQDKRVMKILPNTHPTLFVELNKRRLSKKINDF